MAEIDDLKARLAEVRTAHRQVVTGERVTEVRKGDRLMRMQEITPSNLAALEADLMSEIAALEATAAGTLPRRRFMSARIRL